MRGKILSTLPLFAVQVFGWNHVSPAEFSKAVKSNDWTTAACTSQESHLTTQETDGVADLEPMLEIVILSDEDRSKTLETEWLPIQGSEPLDTVLSIDCALSAQLCEEHKVKSVPAIRLFRSDSIESIPYRGPRKTASIVSFLRRARRPALSVVTEHNITSFASIDDVVFVGFLAHEDKGLRSRWEHLARKYADRFSFAVVYDLNKYDQSLACYNNFDDGQRSVGSAELEDVGALEMFVRECATPVIPELTRRNEMEYYGSGKSLVHYFVANEEDRLAYVLGMRPLARKYQEYLHFTTTLTSEYPDALAMLGQKPGSSKVLSVQNPSNGDVFPYTGSEPISPPVVEEFLIGIIEGRVAPWNGAQESHDRHDEL